MSKTFDAQVLWLGSNKHVGNMRITVSEWACKDSFSYLVSVALQKHVAKLLNVDESDCDFLRVTIGGKALTRLYLLDREAHKDALKQEMADSWRQIWESEPPVTLHVTRFPERDVARDRKCLGHMVGYFRECASLI